METIVLYADSTSHFNVYFVDPPRIATSVRVSKVRLMKLSLASVSYNFILIFIIFMSSHSEPLIA